MTIISANVFNVTGRLANMTLHANTIDASGYSNIAIADNLRVAGSVYTTERMDVGSTIYATFRLACNIPFDGHNEMKATSNTFRMDWTSTDMMGMTNIQMSTPRSNIYNQITGEVTVPVSGLYHLEMQGVFQNDPGAINPQNGVYYYFKNLPYPSARVATNFTSGNIVSTSHSAFLLGGDRFVPTFYSNDPQCTLVPSNGETYVQFVLAATVTPTHSNYIRYP